MNALLLPVTLYRCADSGNLLTFFKRLFSNHASLLQKLGDWILQLSHALGSDEVSFLSATSDWMLLFFRDFQRSLIYTITALSFIILFLGEKGYVTEVPQKKNVESLSWSLLETFKYEYIL